MLCRDGRGDRGVDGKTVPRDSHCGRRRECAVFNRLTAEYTGKTVEAGPTEATALGNLAAQMIAAGEFEDLRAARACIADSFAMESLKERRENEMTGYEAARQV